MWLDFDVKNNRRWTFSLQEALLRIMESYFGQKRRFEVKNVLMDLFIINAQLLSSQDVNWWTGVVWITCGLLWCFYQLFGLSFWRDPFTADSMHFSKSDEETISSTPWMAWVSASLTNFHFWLNCSLSVICLGNKVCYLEQFLWSSSDWQLGYQGWPVPCI